MVRIEADIALESWMFGFQSCLGQGQFTPSVNLQHSYESFIMGSVPVAPTC